MRRRVVILVYLALFVGELSWSGVTPLIPTYIEKFDLTDLAGGGVLSVASLGILIASLPASMVTRRVSPRALTLTAMAVIAVAGVATGLATTYAEIIAGRFVFGLGFGTLWVSMAAWLADAAGAKAPQVLALTTSIVGISATMGPACTGWLAQHWGLHAPFLVLSVITALLFVLLMFDRSGTGRAKDPAPPFGELVRAATSDPSLVSMLLLTTGAAVLWMTADLLVPLRLDDAGFDIAGIGFTFSVSAFVFAGASALTARGADRWARPSIAAGATLGLAAVTMIPALFVGVPAALVFLFGASIATGVIVALTFPIGLHAVERGVVTVALMSALANIIWALSGMAGPTVGGAFAEWVGDQAAFAILALVCLLVAVLVLRLARVKVSGTRDVSST